MKIKANATVPNIFFMQNLLDNSVFYYTCGIITMEGEL